MIRQLKAKDYKNFIYYCQNRDPYSDFYRTTNNKRIFLNNPKVARSVFNDCIKHSDKCYIKETDGLIVAILLIIGYKDGDERKYLKVLSSNKKDVKDLFSFLIWQKLKPDVFAKVHKTNTNFGIYDERNDRFNLSYAIKRAGFRVIAVRDQEILLKKEDFVRRSVSKPNYNINSTK